MCMEILADGGRGLEALLGLNDWSDMSSSSSGICHSPSVNTSEQLDSGESGSLKGKDVSLIVFSESLGLYSSLIIVDNMGQIVIFVLD